MVHGSSLLGLCLCGQGLRVLFERLPIIIIIQLPDDLARKGMAGTNATTSHGGRARLLRPN